MWVNQDFFRRAGLRTYPELLAATPRSRTWTHNFSRRGRCLHLPGTRRESSSFSTRIPHFIRDKVLTHTVPGVGLLAEQGLSAEHLLIRDRVRSAVPCRNLENFIRQSPLMLLEPDQQHTSTIVFEISSSQFRKAVIISLNHSYSLTDTWMENTNTIGCHFQILKIAAASAAAARSFKLMMAV